MAQRIRFFTFTGLRLFLLASILTGLLVVGKVAPTHAASSTITLVSGGGGAVGTADPNTTYAIQGGGSGSAIIMTPNLAYASPIPGTQWVNTTGLNNSDQASFHTTDYSVTFSLPGNFTAPSITVQVLADNAAMIYLNGAVIGGQPQIDYYPNFQSLSTFTSTTANFLAGTNTLTIANTDFGGPNGVDFRVEVTYDLLLCQPGSYDDGTGCVPADPGHYVPTSGATAQIDCPEGTFQPNSGGADCSVAPPGTYVDTTATIQPTPCPLGSYQPYSGKTSCTLASPGYFVATEGSASQTACTAGYTSDVGASECYKVNTAPSANAGGPYLGAVNTVIAFDGSGSSDAENDPLTYAWNFGDSATGTGVASSHSYTSAGIYNVCLTVNDGSLASASNCTMAVVYDPSAGFVTGGGWINSPAGAYVSDPSLTGKATFGFVSKYKKGASLPTGNTEFQFQAGAFTFHSDTYEWLVVNQNGASAQFKGSGTVNGAVDSNGNAYKFMLWAGDGAPDTFRIRIWWEEGAGNENAVYDNGVNQPINGGSIVVHNK